MLLHVPDVLTPDQVTELRRRLEATDWVDGRATVGGQGALVKRYEGGEHYGLHVDGAIRSVPGTTLQMRTDLSCTLFLAGPHEYEGGELEIVDTYGTHSVRLPAG